MDKEFDLCSGRDFRGQLWFTRVPAGIVRTGMFIRLLGGVFLLVERVEYCGRCPGNVAVRTAAEVLKPVWEVGCRD